MPQFVLLEHDHPYLHWDFMLEVAGVLRTWRLDRIPDKAASIRAEPLADHRLAYLDYEGPVSGNRGIVMRLDRGEYTLISTQPQRTTVRLAGERLRGIAVLGEGESLDSRYQFQWTPDDSTATGPAPVV